MLNIADLKPGMNHANIEVEIVEVSESKKIIMGTGIKRDVLELKVKDKNGHHTVGYLG